MMPLWMRAFFVVAGSVVLAVALFSDGPLPARAVAGAIAGIMYGVGLAMGRRP